ncbi:MAG: DUF262 domain-containing HNH endonuclease family protein [Cyclobacteriaceae bacterium]
MNLGKPHLEDLFNKQIRFRIPVFQRHYVWNEQEQWQPLWDDYINKLNERQNGNKIHPHYTGSIVLFQESTTTSTLSTYSVIDGQQRLTTFQLFITAFREICRKYVGDDKLINQLDKLLFNDETYGQTNYEDQKFKLEPTKFNKELFNIILNNTYEDVNKTMVEPILSEYGIGPKGYRKEAKRRHRMLAAYLFFYEQFEELMKAIDEKELPTFVPLCLTVLKRDFQFVEIDLDQNDDPQMIFETMNGRGASLTETDLIRNYIFMRADRNQINLDKVYEKYWDEFDDAKSEFKWHEQTSRGRYYESHLQFYIIDYLTLKLRTDIRYDQVFYHYKQFVINKASFESIEDELRELNRYSSIYKEINKPNSKTTLGRLARRLKDMEISTIYPLLLAIEGSSEISGIDKNKIYEALDSYVTRRFLCGYTTKNYNNVFLEHLKHLDQHKNADEFIDYLKSKTGETNLWPTDNVLKEKLQIRPIYREEKNRTKSLSNILLEIEQFQRGKKQEKIEFPNEGLTIEHILPQKWYEHWPLSGNEITKEDFEISIHAVMTEEDKNGHYHQIENRNKLLHCLGNLTLLTDSLNPAVSNSNFKVKQKELAKQSTLKLNTYFLELDDWGEEQIQIRTEELIDNIVKIWCH